MSLHSDIVVPYIHEFGSEAQKERWLRGCASGALVTAIAMTEPGTGSDLAAIQTRAIRDGDDYVLTGAKTFISNGILCDLCVVAAKTDPDPANAHRGISLFVVEAGRPGFLKGKKLKKMGMASQDTAELAFEECRVPAANRLGEEGAGFLMLMKKLQQERIVVAVGAQAAAEQVLKDTIAYTQERKAFGKPIVKFQNTQFKLVECATKVEVGRAFLDRLTTEHLAGKYLVKECSMAKLWQTEMAGARGRRVPAVLRRVRLHARIPDRAGVHGRPRRAHLRRDERDHEGDHRQADGAVASSRTPAEKATMASNVSNPVPPPASTVAP